jgi:hypothetical protein
VLPANDLPTTAASPTTTAIKDLTLSGTTSNVIANLTVYVYGTLTVNSDSVAPTGTVKAIGKINVTGNNDAVLASPNVVYTGATISGTTGVEITTKAGSSTGDSGTFNIASGSTIKVKNITFAGAVKGEGTLTLSANVTKAVITGGGKVVFSGVPAFATDPSSFGGPVVFESTVGSTNVALTFDGPVTFGDNVTRTTGGVYTFGGDVTLAATKTITLGGAATVNLAEGASIKVGADTVLTAVADTVITPTAGAILTATAAVTTSGSEAPAKLALGTQALELTSGTLTVATGAELALTTALTVKSGASLVLTGATGTTGAKISGTAGTGGVKAGATTITGAWQAVTATGGTAGPIAITATAAETATANIIGTVGNAFTAGTDGLITQAAEASNNLTIGANTEIALGGVFGTPVGKIVLTGAASNPAVLTLIGKITGETLTTPVAAADITITNATLAGTNTINGTTGTNKNLGSLTGTAANNTITAGGNGSNVTLNAAATIKS